jgi:NAD(P)-dependent dehydrogenase (short-subunit alcohol dehydrogenase family)
MDELHGKVAVVTGAASGIGRAMAARFVSEGLNVVLADIEEGPLAATRMKLSETATVARVIDVGDEKSVNELAEFAYDTYGAVHILCNNAGVFAGGRIWRRPAADFEWALRVNLWGILHGIHAFVPRMIAQNTQGHIINTCSIASLFAKPLVAPYAVAKFAAFAATQCLAQELALMESKLRVSALCPDSVATNIDTSSRNRPADLTSPASPDTEYADRLAREMVRTGITSDEVAVAVVNAIRTERFLVLTNEATATELRAQTEALLDGYLPAYPFVDN